MIIKENSCPCAYCKFFKVFEYYENNITLQKGVCVKHNLIRELCDELCEDFILKEGVHTQKWYPGK